MKRPYFLLFFLLMTSALFGQADSSSLERIYTRAAHFTEAHTDSIQYYANYMDAIFRKGHFPITHVMGLSLHGYYYENKADYKTAVDYYLQALEAARRLKDIPSQVKCLTDLTAVYAQDMKQPQKAKDLYLECVRLTEQLGDPHSIISSFNNLSAIYTRLGLYDSALLFLHQGLLIGKPLEADGEDLSSLYNNIGTANYFLKKYDTALFYFRRNLTHDIASQTIARTADLWLDYLNMADAYTLMGSFDSARKYGDLSLRLAQQLNSKSKESDSYSILSKLAQRKGDYKKAWEYQSKWYELDTALVNGDTYKAIAELEAKYEADEREKEKLLLQEEVVQQKFKARIMMVMAVSLLLIAILAAMAFIIKKRANRKLQTTNDLVIRQNDRLSELNYEKNSLISIVSHDLSTPFASIGMWHQLLLDDDLSSDQKKAVDRIGQATRYGENLIRRILDVEKAETNQRKVNLENLDLCAITKSVMDEFAAAASKKNIQLHLDCSVLSSNFLSDRHLFGRMLENLLSNAIKYTPIGKNVWLSIDEEKDNVIVGIRDEGVGIPPDELPHLFSKYSKISSQPTNGEPSTGLGLAIVRRICEELNGKISCESTPGKGSVFTVQLKK